MSRWSPDVEKLLRDAGWSEECRVDDRELMKWREGLDVPGGFAIVPAAEAALRQFGGLAVNVSGPGLDVAKTSFEIDPSLAVGEEDRFARFRSAVGGELYPLGEVDAGHAFLAIAGDGRVFIVGDEVHLAGDSMAEAVSNLLSGRRPATPTE